MQEKSKGCAVRVTPGAPLGLPPCPPKGGFYLSRGVQSPPLGGLGGKKVRGQGGKKGKGVWGRTEKRGLGKT